MSPEPGRAHFEGLTPLVDEATLSPPPRRKPPRESAGQTLSRLMQRARGDGDLRWVRRVGVVALAILLLAGGVFGAWALLPRSIPNVATAPMDDVMDFMLLSDDFNRLPVEERLALVKDLIERLKTMSADDSSALAMFAASIEREMRRQLEENVKRLAVDVVDKFARDYESVPPEEAGRFLDEKIVEFTKMMEEISGEPSRLPEDPDARLAALRRQAKRDQEAMRANTTPPDSRRLMNAVSFMRRDAEQIAGPEQRSRVTKFGRDVTRHLRGQDISTGKPLPPGDGGG